MFEFSPGTLTGIALLVAVNNAFVTYVANNPSLAESETIGDITSIVESDDTPGLWNISYAVTVSFGAYPQADGSFRLMPEPV